MKIKLIVVAILLFFIPFSYGKSVVIVHKSLSLTLTSKDIRDLYILRKTSFSNDTIPHLYIPKDGIHRQNFIEKVLKMSEKNLQRKLVQMMFSGQGHAPIPKSPAEILSLVSVQENAIGIIDESLVTSQVKVLFSIE
ncbi:MAG: hypothetical protein HRT53_07845 [Colwellia sp.]|nr:hypothetical protein [Colwellia sp.]